MREAFVRFDAESASRDADAATPPATRLKARIRATRLNTN
jgi:hypothetical protein